MLTRFAIRLCCFVGAAWLLFLLLRACAPTVEEHDFIMASPAPLPCRYAAGVFLAALDAELAAWHQAEVAAAQAASALELSAPLTELRTIRNRVEALEAPPCAWNLRQSAISFMSEVIWVYDLASLGQPQNQIDLHRQTAQVKKDYFELDYAAMRGTEVRP